MSACSGRTIKVTVEDTDTGEHATGTVTCGATESCADCIDRAVAIAKQNFPPAP